jgi:hypothetical protein
MAIKARVGQSREIDGRIAGQQAAQLALEQLGHDRAAFAWLAASDSYSTWDVLDGVNEALGNVPSLGFSTTGVLTAEGYARRSVVVALLAGEDAGALTGLWTDYIHDSRACVLSMLESLQPDAGKGQSLLVVADGFNGDAAHLCSVLSRERSAIAGCLAAGDLRRGRTFQVGGRQAGSGGLAAAVLGGDIQVGVGAAHGWRPVGALARLTGVHGVWVRAIDEQPASETYARLFGRAARDWSHPPLNDLVRLYPLGVRNKGGDDWLVRSPLRMEADGSLRMNTALKAGETIDFMIGSQDVCLDAARQAARQALDDLGSRPPELALVIVDAAWQKVFETDPGGEVRAVQEVLGKDVPLAGAYTLGQIARSRGGGQVQLLNQHIVVVLFCERIEK